jgi:hypothetical protein
VSEFQPVNLRIWLSRALERGDSGLGETESLRGAHAQRDVRACVRAGGRAGGRAVRVARAIDPPPARTALAAMQ